jgi:hypothetical protein
MFVAMHALTQEQLMDAKLTSDLALKYDTVMVEQASKRSRQGHYFGIVLAELPEVCVIIPISR